MFNKFFTFTVSAFIALVFTSMSFAQAVIFEDNFDSYTAGLQLACQNPVDWDTWSNAPCDATEDAFVSDLHALSGANSTVIVQNNDLIHHFGVLTSGKYSISMQIYIPAGKAGYFNTMSEFAGSPQYWAMEVYFDAGGGGRLATGLPDMTFSWAEDTWQSVEVIVDLDNDMAEFWFDGTFIGDWQWTVGASGGTGPLQIDVNDFFGATADDEMYVDDYTITDLLAPPPVTGFSDDFEAYTVGLQLACQNPVDWDTWSNAPCGSEDPFISDAYSYSGNNSFVEISGNDLIRRHGDQTTGKWWVSFLFYIPDTRSGYFNTMNDFDGSPQVWGMDCFFDAGGAGRLDTEGGGGGGNVVDFSWTADVWSQAVVVIDLDATPPTAEFWTGTSNPLTMIATWDWTQGGTKPAMLAVNDFFGGAGTDEMYVDDFYFGDTPPVILPVELTSFTANVNNEGDVILNWSTATELNNQLFEIERKSEEGQYVTIGYVNGHGTTTEPQEYSYIDNSVETGIFFYRLKQIDFGGRYEYSDAIEIDVKGPLAFGLDQNYPNPFNPSTNINYRVSETGNVRLSIYNTLGEEVAVLVDGLVQAGFYEITFDASNLPSGAYFYRLQSGNNVKAKKMLLMK